MNSESEAGNERKPKDFSLVVFPFLKTSHPVTLGHCQFRTTDDTKELRPDQAAAVTEVVRMLYLKDDLRLKSASYAIVPFVDLSRGTPEDISDLRRVQALVAYLYAAPHPSSGRLFLSTEHASLIVFSPAQVLAFLVRPGFHVIEAEGTVPLVPDHRGEVRGYWCLYNFRHHFWVAPGSRVYGPEPHLTLNDAQDLGLDLSMRSRSRPDLAILQQLLEKPLSKGGTRVFTALQWFNTANLESSDEAASIVDLAIAFEALLGLPESEKRDRIVDAIALLLGRVPRLDVWASQFYRARSDVVHEGRTARLRFVATDDLKGSGGQVARSLLAYGRQVFRLCMATVLSGLQVAEAAGLEEKFVTNMERFQRICKIASDTNIALDQRLRLIEPLVDAIGLFRFDEESDLQIDAMVGAVRAVARLLLDSGIELEPRVKSALQSVEAVDRDADHFRELEAIGEASSVLPDFQPDAVRDTALMRKLLGSVWHYVWMHYYWLKEARRSSSDGP